MERVPRTCVGMWHPCGTAWAFDGWNVWVFWLACLLHGDPGALTDY